MVSPIIVRQIFENVVSSLESVVIDGVFVVFFIEFEI